MLYNALAPDNNVNGVVAVAFYKCLLQLLVDGAIQLFSVLAAILLSCSKLLQEGYLSLHL